jgi:hypothetical protein
LGFPKKAPWGIRGGPGDYWVDLGGSKGDPRGVLGWSQGGHAGPKEPMGKACGDPKLTQGPEHAEYPRKSAEVTAEVKACCEEPPKDPQAQIPRVTHKKAENCAALCARKSCGSKRGSEQLQKKKKRGSRKSRGSVF